MKSYITTSSTGEQNTNSLRILSAIGIIVGCWSLLFEILFFKGFILEIYFARILFTVIAFTIFAFSFNKASMKATPLLTHIFLLSLIGSFVVTIYKIPDSVFINSQILSLVIFTTAIVFSWDAKNQIIAAIYYNVLFSFSIVFSDHRIYKLPNLFSLVIFVSLISFLSIAASFIHHNLRVKLSSEQKEREEAVALLLQETKEKENQAQRVLAEKKQKIELLAKINHEVRTPLSSILMYFDMLEDGNQRSPDEIRNYSKSVRTSSQRLLNTINNFVDYAKIETGKLDVQNELFNLNDEVENAIQLLLPLANSKNNELKIVNDSKSKILVYSDPVKYRQILINLVANAIKVTGNGKITVTFSTNQISGDNYEIITSVRDTGPGISEEKLGLIFDPFVTLNNENKKGYSSGLGLSICKEFINMLNGKIKVESKLGFGTVFTFTIQYEYNYENMRIPQQQSTAVS